jgi:hypothetical protein
MQIPLLQAAIRIKQKEENTMKHMLIRIVVIAMLVLLVGMGTLWIANGPAKAALGNQGIPVRCHVTSSGIAPGATSFLSCATASPPYFVSGQRVPDNYYFLVTDVMASPQASTTGAVRTEFYLYDAYGINSRASTYHFRSVDGATFGEHFTTPLYVLTPDHRLEVQAFNANAAAFDIYVTGLLVTNVSYLPLALDH